MKWRNANEYGLIEEQIDGLVQECSNHIANALELLLSCIKPSKLG